MNEKRPDEQVAGMLMKAITPAIEAIARSGDKEAMGKIAPSLFILGITLMVKDIGRDAAVLVIQDVVEKMKSGAFDESIQ
ncbi:MAG: hypothetical protein HY788_06630 [Deltaproteobacteria bacterium]|nr:hypothetical protein [Deltaproteobacteria bacterium]